MDMAPARVLGIESRVPAEPVISFAARFCARIAAYSPEVAENCSPLLEALDVDALMERGESRFTVERHTQLIWALTQLETDQIQNLIDNPDPAMADRERSFCQHHFRLAKYERAFQQREEEAVPLIGRSNLVEPPVRYQCYIDYRDWDVVVEYAIDPNRVKLLFKHFIEKEANLDLAAQVLSRIPDVDDDETTHGRQAIMQSAVEGVRKYRAIERLLELDSSIANASALQLARELSSGGPNDYTAMTSGTEERYYSERGYAHIVRVLMGRGQLERAETIALTSDEADRGPLLYYIAYHLVEWRSFSIAVPIAISQKMVERVCALLDRRSTTPEERSLLIHGVYQVIWRLPVDEGVRAAALHEVDHRATPQERAFYALSTPQPQPVPLAPPVLEAERGVDVAADPVEGLSFIERAYACLNWIKDMFQRLLTCIQGQE